MATFLDDYSKMSIVQPLKHKSDVPAAAKHIITFMEKQAGQELLVLRSDNGAEYLNRKVGGFLKNKGVLHQTSNPYTPEQNGAAERLNRTLMERVRAMLEDSGLPKSYWAEAVCSAAYIRNRSPAAGRAKTPWELFFGKTPDVSNMRTFGAEAYALVPKQLRQKLDNHSQLGRFVGYSKGQKGYRIALPSGKVISCGDVVFVEDITEQAQQPEEEAQDTVEIDLDEPGKASDDSEREDDDSGPGSQGVERDAHHV